MDGYEKIDSTPEHTDMCKEKQNSTNGYNSSTTSSRSLRTILWDSVDCLSPRKRLPIVNTICKYNTRKLTRDALAGLTVALTTVPYCIALASISGLDPEYPLGASIIGNIVYAFLGTSKDLNIGSTAAVALLMRVYSEMGHPEYARFLAFYTGVLEILFGILQLSSLVNYVSPTVLSAFMSATSITIIINQLRHFFGLTLDRSSDRSIVQLYQVVTYLNKVKFCDLCMGLGSLSILFTLRYLSSRPVLYQKRTYELSRTKKLFLRLLGTCSLMSNVLVLAIAGFIVFMFQNYNLNLTLVRSNLSPANLVKPESFPFIIPDSSTNKTLGFEQVVDDVKFGLATVPLLAMLFTIAVAKSFGRKNEYRIDVTQEFLAFGVANVVASFFKSFPIAASISRTAVNSHCNVATPISGLFSSAFVVIFVQFASSCLHFIPRASLSAVIISCVVFSIDIQTIKNTFRVQKREFLVVLTTIVAALVLSPELALLLGILASLIIVLMPMANPKPEVEEFKNGRLLVFTFDHGLKFPASELLVDFFVENLDYFNSYERQKAGKRSPKLCIVDLSHVFQIDYSIFHGFTVAKEYFESRGTAFYFVQARPSVKALFERVNSQNFRFKLELFEDLSSAVQAYKKQKRRYSLGMSNMLMGGTSTMIDSYEVASLYGSLYP